MAVRVLMFGPLQDIAGWRERSITDAPATLFALRSELSRADPRLAAALARPGVQVALDKAVVRGDAPLAAGAEVAFLPPMSGG